MPTETCLTCRYWGAPLPAAPAVDRQFDECRRYPPKVLGLDQFQKPVAAHPRTKRIGWCGEWSARAANDDTSLVRTVPRRPRCPTA